jgi:hypothetical protein
MENAARQDVEKTIVIRDRRKPNQYTTDNTIAREWLPVLRTGDAFFFYSVYLSMANRETESSWSSLRTLAKYLQCGVDLIIRGNKLLEICELIYIEPGNQRASNEYFILDPPPLTPALRQRIERKLDDIAATQTGKNWQAWVRQVRKALDKHRSLPSIWAERRARRGGRPRTQRPQNGAREPQAGFSEKGVREPQAQRSWDTTTAHVTHMQAACESQPEQEQQTSDLEQEILEEEEDTLSLLVRARCQHLGIGTPIVDVWLERYDLPDLVEQLDWLPFRHPRDPAAMLVSAVQGRWTQPSGYDAQQAQAVWADWMADDIAGQDGTSEPLSSEDVPAEGTPAAALVDGVDAAAVWAQVLEELRMQMTRATFDTWLRGSRVADARGDELVVRVRDGYAVDWLRARWLAPIERTLAGMVGHPVAVRFEV